MRVIQSAAWQGGHRTRARGGDISATIKAERRGGDVIFVPWRCPRAG